MIKMTNALTVTLYHDTLQNHHLLNIIENGYSSRFLWK